MNLRLECLKLAVEIRKPQDELSDLLELAEYFQNYCKQRTSRKKPRDKVEAATTNKK